MTTETEDKLAHAKSNARGWLQSIREMVQTWERANNGHAGRDEPDEDDALEAIHQSVLSVEVRDGWYSPGARDKADAPAEFCILLSTGGPALRLIGDLDTYGEPEEVRLEMQDWGIAWTEFRDFDHDDYLAMMTFCRRFYFGEG